MGSTIKIIILGSIVILSVEAAYFFVFQPKNKVLSEKVEATQTPTQSPTPSPTPSPSPSPTARPTKTPAPTSTPTPVPPQEVNALIDRFSAQYNVDPNVMRHIAICESGFNPNAVNGAYAGLFQFGPVTWQNIRALIGEDTDINLRFSAEEAAQTAAYALSQGKRGIWPNCAP